MRPTPIASAIRAIISRVGQHVWARRRRVTGPPRPADRGVRAEVLDHVALGDRLGAVARQAGIGMTRRRSTRRTRIRTEPIAERDVIEYLASTPRFPPPLGARSTRRPRRVHLRADDRANRGRDGRRAPAARARRIAHASGAAVVAAVTGQPLELVRPLIESLESDLLPREPAEARALYGLRPFRFERAVERALAEWESPEPLGAR